MRFRKSLFLLLCLILFTGCERGGGFQSARPQAEPVQTKTTSEGFAANQVADAPAKKDGVTTSQVSLNQAGQSQSIAEAMDRKIIRDAEFTLESSAPQDAQRKISSIAETIGGFVVTSESKQRESGEPGKQYLEVKLVVRVPAAQFGAALDQIRSAGDRVIQEKITGQDVTEEFIDLEARIKTQKALELQFLEIMKQAHKVEDALEVQSQIADVRTEIEKLEGRKRFLENRATLSTITVNLLSPTAIAVNTSGFGRSVRAALADGVDVAIAIVLFLIRFVIVMVPVVLLLILPLWLIARYFWRRARRNQQARKQTPISSPAVPVEPPIHSEPNK
jgi:hypothetical protein